MMPQQDLCWRNVAIQSPIRQHDSRGIPPNWMSSSSGSAAGISQGETEGCERQRVFSFLFKTEGQSRLRDGKLVSGANRKQSKATSTFRDSQSTREPARVAWLQMGNRCGQRAEPIMFSRSPSSTLSNLRRQKKKKPPALACAAAPRDSQEAPRFVDFSKQNCGEEILFYLFHVNQLAAFRHLVFLHQVMEEFRHYQPPDCFSLIIHFYYSFCCVFFVPCVILLN